jgi:Ca2+-binding EF-hand superfamily protein
MNKNIEYLVSASLSLIAVVFLGSYFSQHLGHVPMVRAISTNSTDLSATSALLEGNEVIQLAAVVANGTQSKSNIRIYDLNRNGVIELGDVSIVATYIRMNTYDAKADFNKDQKINLADLGMMRKAIGTTAIYQHDYNGDGKVSFADVAYIGSAINAHQYNPLYDFDANGVVGLSDLLPIQSAAAANPVNAYDYTTDGKITYDDVMYVASTINAHSYNANFDFNADGVVGLPDLAKIRSVLISNINAYDFTRDGKITYDDVSYVASMINTHSYDANFDFDADGMVSILDLAKIRSAILTMNDAYDFTRDGQVTYDDVSYVASAINTYSYDANFDLNSDGRVDNTDLPLIRGAITNTINAYDFTRDGKITYDDVMYVASEINTYSYDANFDLDSNGIVGTSDLAKIRSAILTAVDAYDFTRDGKIDASDVQYVQNVANTFGYDANFDLNSDGRVDALDVAIIQNSITNPYPTATTTVS